MLSKPHKFPEIAIILVSFDMMPTSDHGLMQMARYDLARIKRNTKATNAFSRSNSFRVVRHEKWVGIEFLDMMVSEEKRTQLRMIYKMAPPFR